MRIGLSIALVFCCYLFTGLLAQEITSTKLDLATKRMLNGSGFKWDNINLFVKGDPGAIAGAAERAGGFFKYTYGGISAVNIPIVHLEGFLAEDAVLAVQNGDIPVTTMNDTAIVINSVLEIQTGAAPLTSMYKGAGVVMGIVDDGIDINHLDFKKANGETRIRFLWDQSVGSVNSPEPYNYGRQWTEIEINNGQCTQAERVDAFSHGTHVSGIAAGNGRATGNFTGMAPETDLVIVHFDYTRPFLSSVVDGFDYIYKKADAMGKPCVINASLGTYSGSHDGDDFATILIEALLDERNGRALVCAAGNAGQHKYHLGYEVSTDTAFTWFKYNSNTGAGDVFFQLYADTADFNDVYFAFGGDNPTTWTNKGQTQFLNVKVDYPGLAAAGGSIIKNYQIYNGTTFIGNCATQLTLEGGRYLFEVQIQPQNLADYWRFVTTGSGRFDIWSSKNLMNSSDMVYAGLPDYFSYPAIDYYRAPDTMKTIVSSYNCSDKVISVGNFNNRGKYVDVYNDTIYSPYPVGAVFVDQNPVRESTLGSSYGPTRDGRIKPDISAPGTYVLSSGNAQYIAAAIGSGNPNNYEKIAKGGKHFRNGGTSMASPMVAGAVALYLEKYPNASWREIKDAMLLTAFRDIFTGPDSNNAYGYGKLNAFEAIQVSIIYGCTDTAALNYDPLAQRDNGSCLQAIYGCMDPFAINYDSLANVNDGSCFFDSIPDGITGYVQDLVRVGVYPNPSKGAFRVFYAFGQMPPQAEVIIVNVLGQTIAQRELQIPEATLNFDGWQPGMYIYYLKADGQVLKEGRLIVQ